MTQATGTPPAAKRPTRVSKRNCTVPDCVNRVSGHDLCSTHLLRVKKCQPLDAPLRAKWKGKPCSVDDCDKGARKRGWCEYHYLNWRRHGDPAWVPPVYVRPVCSVADCPDDVYAKGWCFKHYQRVWRRGTADPRPRRTEAEKKASRKAAQARRDERALAKGRSCRAADCPKPPRSVGLCDTHYQYLRLWGDPLGSAPKRPSAVDPFRYELPSVCEVDGCGETAYGVGYCRQHYNQYRKHGSPFGPQVDRPRAPYPPRSATPEQRFWMKVDRNGPVSRLRPDLGECWIWIGALSDDGYGLFRASTEEKRKYAHRYAWEMSGRSLVARLTLDHLCAVRPCVRPEHLDQVTQAVNAARSQGVCASNARKTHCKRGHEFTPENTMPGRRGRVCRACYNVWRQRRRATEANISRQDKAVAREYRRAIATDRCIYCGGPAKYVDHLFPVTKGGTDHYLNLGRACGPCNRAKRDRCATWFVLRNGNFRSFRLLPQRTAM